MGNICEATTEEPHMTNYAGNLQFFTNVVRHLENRSERYRQLVEERSRGLLARAFYASSAIFRTSIPSSTLMPPSPQCLRPFEAT